MNRLIMFTIFTKWWYVLVLDGPDEILLGFPLPYICDGWHTSMSKQYFVLELIVDLLSYFTICFSIVYIINKFMIMIKPHKIVTITLVGLAVISLAWNILLASNPDNVFHMDRNFSMKTIETGYKFIWQKQERPDATIYYPEKGEDGGN